MDGTEAKMWGILFSGIHEEKLKRELLIRGIFQKIRFIQEIDIEKEVFLLLKYHGYTTQQLEELDEIMDFQVKRCYEARILPKQPINYN
jgi:hypothetical protein